MIPLVDSADRRRPVEGGRRLVDVLDPDHEAGGTGRRKLTVGSIDRRGQLHLPEAVIVAVDRGDAKRRELRVERLEIRRGAAGKTNLVTDDGEARAWIA